ncbi:hypothetical protein B4U79_13263 [Dinothrombium tinctorium]|uniref:Beta-ketoacyl synthase-like N-terminal domain-containing protein n=1 Tax=Dinothrombium tinctorium TaxID=1965070 RepID=A0A3S3Q9A4_9ACAR|nr:hypothetical protein B4U79_13263 [Dinothrombium tinctorium]
MDDDIVISGIAGRYPESDDIYEFWEKLVNGVELNSSDARRWPVGYLGLPPYSGKIKSIEKIDADFFKLGRKEADFTDPQIRLLYEVVYETIWDAG